MASCIPHISIIVPVYNVEKYLRRCIDSILAQTFTNFELLLIDDGSTDKSGEICDEYVKRDNRIKVFHKENGGVSSARNVGLDHMIGKWVCFCDSDDYVLPSWLKNLCPNNNSDLIISGFIAKNNNGLEMKQCIDKSLGLRQTIIELERKDIFGYLWCKCFKASIIKKANLKFDIHYIIWEDVLFIYQYFCQIQTVTNIKAFDYVYNQPDFNKKYKKINNFDCSLSIIICIGRIFDYKYNYAYQKQLNSLFAFLLAYYKMKNYNVAYDKLCEYKFIAKKFGKTKYHKILNYLIMMLPIHFSHIILSMMINVKQLLRIKNRS